MSDAHPVHAVLARARAAAAELAAASAEEKHRALAAVAKGLRTSGAEIAAANALDVQAAKTAGLSPALVDRLLLDAPRIEKVARGVEHVQSLPDPVGEVTEERTRPNGLVVRRVRVPLGVVAIVYESRPDVTIDAAVLCVKAGDAVVLRGGREAAHTNEALGNVLGRAFAESGLPRDAAQVIAHTDRAWVEALLTASGEVDLVIPRGGEGLVRFVEQTARVPVLFHAKGNCHVYVDAAADAEKAVAITVNAKARRPGVCNAAETLLVDRAAADRLLVPLLDALAAHGVELRGCEETCRRYPAARPATPRDWDEEYLDLVMAVRVVEGVEGAIEHIRRHGSHHTEAIVSENAHALRRFRAGVDASCVVTNASTRFNDGGELGLGAEIGISTSKLHAYGPMGLRELTTLRFEVEGSGQVRL